LHTAIAADDDLRAGLHIINPPRADAAALLPYTPLSTDEERPVIMMKLLPSTPRELSRGGRRILWRSGLLPVICAALAVTAGCSSMAGVEPLEVTLSNLKITEVTVFETTLVAKLRVTNPNPEALTINGGSFKLILDDKKVGTGTASETFTVERLDSAVIDAVFHLNNASALLRVKDILQEQEVTYGVSGSLFTERSFGTRKIKIEKTGRLDLSNSNPTVIEEPDINDPEP
jgi:LEA14-like dessication related protein